MQQISLGQRVRAISIPRTQVANGVKGRAIIIDPNPRVKQIAYDAERRRRVEVDQDACIKYHLTARVTYFLLIGRLNTDMKGNVVDSDMQVEYLSMSESTYNKFADSAVEMGDFSGLLLKKESRGDNDQYGFVLPTPSNAKIPQEIYDKVEKMRNTPGVVESIWQLIDQDTSLSLEQYEKLLESEEQQPNNSHMITGSVPQPRARLAAPQQSTPQLSQPQNTQEVQAKEVKDDFSGDDFGDFSGGDFA